MEATLTRTKPKPETVIENTAIYKIAGPLKFEIEDSLLNILSTDAEDILKDDYVNGKVLEDKTIEQIKDKYNFDDIKDAFDDRQVLLPTSLNFFGGENENFVNACHFLSLKKENNEFISFLCSVMGKNSLSIHVESRDIFYNDFNIKENFCWRSKMNQKKLYKNKFPIIIALKGIRVNIYRHIHWKKLISLICFLIKIQNIYCTNLMTG